MQKWYDNLIRASAYRNPVMKFGESLNQGVIPEWEEYYVEYKRGKKLIKKLAAAKEAEQEPKSNDRTPLLQPQDKRKGYGPNVTPAGDLSNPDVNNGLQSSVRAGGINFRTTMFTPSIGSSMKRRKYDDEKKDFMDWLNSELAKIETFFQHREQAVYERFLILEDQLYQLKDHKKATIESQRSHAHSVASTKSKDPRDKVSELAFHTKLILSQLKGFDLPSLPSTTFLSKFQQHLSRTDSDISLNSTNLFEYDINYFENRIRNGESDDLSSFDTDSVTSYSSQSRQKNRPQPQTTEQIRKRKKRDYESKKKHFGVPYLLARKQLKDACLEYYRSLVLLRSYKELNRTAFRKITKKFDKANKDTVSQDFMQHIDKHSYFLTSDIVDKLVFQIEELFISFFEPESTDRKQSLEKFKSIAYALNQNEFKTISYYSEFFSSGLFLGLSIPMLCLSVYVALHKLFNHEMPEAIFLLQIYGGLFFINLLFLLFAVDLIIFEKFKINYKFIFEFNIASALNYRQFCVLPTVSLFVLSLICWFSFNDFWPNKLPGIQWPWFFFGFGLVLFLWPFNHFYLPSRRWLQITLWRLFWSGFYPVEFRDFFIGDMLCSLTYTMGNISFFFCLYATHWSGASCGSSKSRAMGFFLSLPSIWRLLQCVRRYTDTGDWFPHLANMVKYGIGAIYYCLLSVYRINKTPLNRVAFIIMASFNSTICLIWDIVMDWSLLQPESKNFLLRDNLFYHQPYYYYIAMVVDVVLRFLWIFYGFFSNQIQQLAATSFFIALAELVRRVIWVVFRMENEHCTNVILFRASRDTPLPYAVSSKVDWAIKSLVLLHYKSANSQSDSDAPSESPNDNNNVSAYSSSVTTALRRPVQDQLDIECQSTSPGIRNTLRRKSTLAIISDALNTAHIKDFQRKKNVHIEHEDSDDEE